MPRTIRMRTRKCITFISVKHWPVPDKRARHIRQCQAGFLFCLHISQFHSNLECNTILPSGTSTDACHLRRNPPTHTIRCNRMQSLFGNKPAQFENTSNKHCVCVLWIFGTSKPTLTTQNTNKTTEPVSFENIAGTFRNTIYIIPIRWTKNYIAWVCST